MYGYKILEFLTGMPVFTLSTIVYATNCIPTKFLKQCQNRTFSSLSYDENTQTIAMNIRTYGSIC
jgi:hypothetical protein